MVNTSPVTVIAQVNRIQLDGEVTERYTVAAEPQYVVPVDPLEELQCDSCQ